MQPAEDVLPDALGQTMLPMICLADSPCHRMHKCTHASLTWQKLLHSGSGLKPLHSAAQPE